MKKDENVIVQLMKQALDNYEKTGDESVLAIVGWGLKVFTTKDHILRAAMITDLIGALEEEEKKK